MIPLWVEVASKLLPAVAIAVTAVFAILGLNAWRRQMVGKRKFEVAEEGLVTFAMARRALNFVRAPGSFGGEGSTRPPPREAEAENVRDMRNRYYVPLERLKAVDKEFTAVTRAQTLAGVVISDEAAKAFDALLDGRWRVFTSAWMLIDNVGDFDAIKPKEDIHKQWSAAIWSGASNPDEMSASVDAAYKKLQELCRPHLK
jgi:hypothetical protein